MPVRFPFDNSYARLPERLYVSLDPTPVAAPQLVRVNVGLAVSLGLDPEELSSPEGVEVLAGNRRARRRRADRARLCGTPVRPLRAAARRWARHPARRGGRAGRHAARHPAQGLRPDAVLARRRRPRRARPGAARIHRQRGHGGARHPDDPGARRGDDRRAGAARDDAARRRPDARRREPHPRRHLPVFRRARRHRGAATAGRPRDRAPLPARPRRRSTPTARCWTRS